MNRNLFLVNAFSIQMLEGDSTVRFTELTEDDIRNAHSTSEIQSCIGHEDTANVLTNLLGQDVPFNRTDVILNISTTLYIAQLVGGRLPVGATKLPKNYHFKFYRVETVEDWICTLDTVKTVNPLAFTGTYTEAVEFVENLIAEKFPNATYKIEPVRIC